MSSEFRLGTACSPSPHDFLSDAAVDAVAARLARGVGTGAGAGAADCVFVLLSVVTIVCVARDSIGRSHPPPLSPLQPRPRRSRFVSDSERSSNSDENGNGCSRLAGSVIVSVSRPERGDRTGTGLPTPTCARNGNGEPSRDSNGVTRLESEFEYSATYSPDTTPRALGEGNSCASSFWGSYRTYRQYSPLQSSIHPNAYCPMYRNWPNQSTLHIYLSVSLYLEMWESMYIMITST